MACDKNFNLEYNLLRKSFILRVDIYFGLNFRFLEQIFLFIFCQFNS